MRAGLRIGHNDRPGLRVNCPAAVAIDGISFGYGEKGGPRPLYDAFSLTMGKGEVTALMGASGSGKSTLGRLIAGLLAPSRGNVEWADDMVEPIKRVYIDQTPMNSVFPWQSVRRNIEYPLLRLGWSRAAIHERVRHLMEVFGIHELENSYPARLSGGELQRLAIARNLSWRPRLVILDEVFSALDQRTKADVTEAVAAIMHEDQTTALMITHSVSDAVTLGCRAVLLAERPVRVVADVHIPGRYPRDPADSDAKTTEALLLQGVRYGIV